jgi:hypothetical protein
MVWKVLTREMLEETKQQFSPSGYVMQWYAMAMEIILTTLGPEWWKRNCTPNAAKPDEFLAIPNNSEDNKYNHQDRVTKLGHMLYALKECKGYEAFISSLRTRDVAPTFFELWVANILHQNNFVVQFVVPKGQKGEDYDLIAEQNGICLSVEAKSRRAGVVLGERMLHNTLEAARKQLPSSGPGIVFISIPTEWTIDKNGENVAENCINSFFRNSARVNYVVVIWHQWIKLKVGMASASLVRQYENLNPRTPVQLGLIIKPLELPINLDAERQDFKPSFW